MLLDLFFAIIKQRHLKS